MPTDVPPDEEPAGGGTPGHEGGREGADPVAPGPPLELHPTFPIRTSRLLLRPLTADDADELLEYRSLPDVCRYVPFLPMDRAAVAERMAAAWARTEITGEGQGLILGVQVAETGRLVGDVNLLLQSRAHRSAEVGWVQSPHHSGHGYATEAAHAILHLAFDELKVHRVTARVDARNLASIRLAQRLGMRQEALLLQNEWFKGGWSDEVDFALLESEWLSQHREPTATH
ncbi:MAG: GNAT family N-acetyltransferase [Candidatus Dormibacteria bacterium]